MALPVLPIPIPKPRPKESKLYDEVIEWMKDRFEDISGIDHQRLREFCIELENE